MKQGWVELEEQGREADQAEVETPSAPQPREDAQLDDSLLFEADALREEIIQVGRKRWNGRTWTTVHQPPAGRKVPALHTDDDQQRVCSPTTSAPDLDGKILARYRMRTSEVLLHLAIYKANSARPRPTSSHCHPPQPRPLQ